MESLGHIISLYGNFDICLLGEPSDTEDTFATWVMRGGGGGGGGGILLLFLVSLMHFLMFFNPLLYFEI